ncbi:hypothetical protein ACHAWF_012226, partial [Thalassiosira exigua]
MGINDLLPRLPGGDRWRYSMFDLPLEGKHVPFDAAGALWQFAGAHAADFMRGNHTPALIEWARFLNYLRSMCGWRLSVHLDGRENVDKAFEKQRREDRADKAREANNLRGQVKNTPAYIAKAAEVCRFFGIPVTVAAYEADPQVVRDALASSSVPVTGDSDLLAYGPPGEKPLLYKIVIVKLYRSDMHRVIDLTSEEEEGKYPLYDLYREHGRIVFQLYAGVAGCDFTEHRRGIPGIGYQSFIKLASDVSEGLNAATLAGKIWDLHPKLSKDANLPSEGHVARHLQRIVDIYTRGHVYDTDANIVDLSNTLVRRATPAFKRHMKGELNSRSLEEFDADLREQLNSLDCSQLLHCSAADVSTIRGVRLPTDKTVDQCNVSELRDYVAARGGKISLTKPHLVKAAKAYSFLEAQVSKRYVDRHPDPNGTLFVSVSTSCTRSVRDILSELNSKFARATDAPSISSLVADAYELFEANLFDDKYDNISRIAPELKEGLIYKSFGHIGSSITEKNI